MIIPASFGGGLKEIFTGATTGALEKTGNLIIGKRYEIITTEENYFGVGLIKGDRFIASSALALRLANSVREVSPASGSSIYEDFTLHALGTIVPLRTTSDETNIQWIDASGYINITDGTNTAKSTSPLVAGTSSDFHLTWTSEEGLHVTLDGVKGSVEPYTGSLVSDVGNRVFQFFDSSDYCTCRNSYDTDELPFEYVYHEGEIVTHNGEPVIVYT